MEENDEKGLIHGNNSVLIKVENQIRLTNKLLQLSNPYLIPFRKKDKWGFANQKMEIIIPCIYDEAHKFSEGLAAVKKGGVYGYINKQGKEVIEFKFDNGISFSDGVAFVRVRTGYIGDPFSGWGSIGYYTIIDKLGNEKGVLVDAGAFEESEVKSRLQYLDNYYTSFTNERAIIQRDKLYGYIDKNGIEIIPCQYEKADDFKDNLAKVTGENGTGYIDINGNVIVPLIYENFDLLKEGLTSVRRNEKYGFIDINGNEIISCKYDMVLPFSNGRAVFAKDNNHRYTGYLDEKGNEISSTEYRANNNFIQGFALVSAKNGKDFFIDLCGNFVMFKEDGFPYEQPDKRLFPDLELSSRKYGFIDAYGKIIIPHQFDSVSNFVNDECFIIKKLDNHEVYKAKINREGVVIEEYKVDFPHKFIYDYKGSLLVYDLENKYFIVSRDGKKVGPYHYDTFINKFKTTGIIKVRKENLGWVYVDYLGNEYWEH